MTIKPAVGLLLGACLLPFAASSTLAHDRDERRHHGDRCTDADQCERLESIESSLATLLEPAAYVVQAVAVKGPASPGNAEPFRLLVVVTDSRTGAAVATLTQPAFAVISHNTPSGCGFTNQIKTFGNVGTGAYQLGMGFSDAIPGCAWVAGEYMGQVRLPSGQTVFKLTID